MIQKTHAAALALAGALVVAAATPSLADDRWGYAAGGFAAGALVGAAAANTNNGHYYGPGYAYRPYGNQGYAYAPGYQGYAYAPATRYYAPGYSSYSYAPGYTDYNYAPTYDPENGRPDPDPRIGGSFKTNSSGKE